MRGLPPHLLATGIAPIDKNRPVLLPVQYRGHEARGQFALGTLRRLGRAEISRWSLTTHLPVMRFLRTKLHIRSASNQVGSTKEARRVESAGSLRGYATPAGPWGLPRLV